MDTIVDFDKIASKQRFYDTLKMLKGTKLIKIEKYSKKRSNPQNRYYHGCVLKYLSETTGFTVTEMHEVLKAKFPNLKVIAVEPELSPVLSGGTPGPHPLQGIGAGFIPANYHGDLIDEVIQVSKDDAFEYARRIAKEEGILVGISTGASLAAVSKKLETIPDGAVVLTFNYDTGERYLSIEGLF